MTTDPPLARYPRHIAFIMDGNGRWAETRGKARLRGHERGAEALRRIARYCRQSGIREVTFFALSTENYRRRPAREIKCLMALLKRFLTSERRELTENSIRLAVIGDISSLPTDVRRELDETLRLTEGFDGMTLRLALNYGSRQEILAAVRRVAEEALSGKLDSSTLESLDEKAFRRYLHDEEMSDPDLVIRTAGEFRLSNFLLWESSYSEWWISPRLWPDFGVADLEQALRAYDSRERKYGAVGGAPDEAEEVIEATPTG